MLRLALVALALLSILSVVVTRYAAAAATNSLERGTWALEFQVQPSFFGYSNTAVGIAAKHHFANRSAVRLGLMVGINSSDNEGTKHVDRFFPYDTINVTTDLSGLSDRRDISLFLHLARYVGVGSHIGFTLEAGPMVRWISEESAWTETYPDPRGAYANADDRNVWNYGLDAQAGMEWFIRRRLSLAARYGLSANRFESRETHRYDFYNPNDGYWDRRFDEIHSDGFSIQTTSSALSLIAYW
jgi:hypothetical protein